MNKLIKNYKKFFLSLNLDDRAIFILTIITPLFVALFIPLRLITGEYSLVATNSAIVVAMASIHALYLKRQYKLARSIFFSFFCIIIVVIVYLKGHQQLSWVYTAMAVLFFSMKPRNAFLINLIILSIICVLIYDEVSFARFMQDAFSILSLITLVFLLSETSQKRNKVAYEIARTNEIAAMNDPLTGVGNRRAFDVMFDKFTHPSARLREDSLILIDVDHFKSINDTYGHDIGDTVLRWAASVMKSHARSGELIYRIGGEEFAILMEDTPASEARAFAERIRSFFENTTVECIAECGDEKNITISVGISNCKTDNKKTWYKSADKALYAAKSSGRNKIVVLNNDSSVNAGGVSDDKARRMRRGSV